ncbi:MAG: radical SAM protein [Candidatus Gastranaerophilales bacterium]|nr:radical SAM protein [Candidatus Gastranaerophilales bacterium]
MEFSELINLAQNRKNDFFEMQKLGLHCNSGEFIPAGVHYPPITHYPDIEYKKMYENYIPPKDGLIDLYVHFPFCSKCCIFCHYPSQYNDSKENKDKYLNALEKEFQISLNNLGLKQFKTRSILIGGGTPTDLSSKQLEKFLKFFTKYTDLSNNPQFNYDVSPHTLIGNEGLERLKILKDYGVNRLTIGVQSMDDNVLKIMNRPHDKIQAIESIENSMNMGFQTNIEFIYGHPGQTLESWYEELKQIVQIETHEYQFYRLKIDAYGDQQGNIKQFKNNHSSLFPKPQDTIMMKQMVFDYLKTFGIQENLRRVFTKDKKYISKYAYNQCCMQYDQIGLGLTAFSSLRDRFVLNTQNLNEYYSRIENNLLPFNRGYVRDKIAQQRWAIILPLKNWNISKNRFQQTTGEKIENTQFYPIIQKLKEYDLINEDDRKIFLTAKGGFFSDEVVGLFYEKKFIPKPKEFFNEGPLNPYLI